MASGLLGTGAVRVKVDMDESGFARIMSGDVTAYTKGKAGRVAAEARRRAPVKTGALRASIRVAQSRDVLGRYAVGYDVSASVPYALFVHEGTAPHIIRPRRAGGLLRFQVGGQTVFAREVKHPGTRPNPFLADALRVVEGN